MIRDGIKQFIINSVIGLDLYNLFLIIFAHLNHLTIHTLVRVSQSCIHFKCDHTLITGSTDQPLLSCSLTASTQK